MQDIERRPPSLVGQQSLAESHRADRPVRRSLICAATKFFQPILTYAALMQALCWIASRMPAESREQQGTSPGRK